MGTLRELIEARRAEILGIVEKHHGRSAGLFGSVARGEDTATSDVDLLVDFDEDSSLFDLLHLQDELSQLLGCQVDVVSMRALKPRDTHVLDDAVPL